MNKFYLNFIQTVLMGQTSMKLVVGVCLSFAFSISVILCTVGLMDGFDFTLKKGLKSSNGDITIKHYDGEFKVNSRLKKILSEYNLKYTPVLEVQGFVLSEKTNRGVLLRGIDENSFSQITGLEVQLQKNHLSLGDELLKELEVKMGDNLVMALSKDQEQVLSMPALNRFTAGKTIHHGVYQKDLRFAYLSLSELQEISGQETKVNSLLVSLENLFDNFDAKTKSIELTVSLLKSKLSDDYIVTPYWNEYAFLLEAVKIEKFSITMVLQLIVVVAIFNILAFMIFLNEKRSKEIFLMQALGASKAKLAKVWVIFNLCLWAFACIGGYLLTKVFSFLLANVEYLQLPGDVYGLTSIELLISPKMYVLVYGLALAWLMLITFVGIFRMNKKTILSGLRKEFT